ncbi:lytic polysaccharide monooxygenase [Amniculicola lignicola CBS 123094]|uniref:Lytic polysaccharide monooxygenase n=1 Tax=Amniculicola lignicola CBS 123094 TaxID=1392246 RepID=A0A6A5VYS0_9PLEO|nr:lytic polysaccharide monooxygenase [Amniculicola lignicola CBS 123094]
MLFSRSLMAAALAAGVNAHMYLEFPVPYGNSTINSSPLERFGSDYPCKQRPGVYEVTKMNEWNAGETKEVSFIGSAVHGGGSCQFSITTDLEPSKDTQWKVIHSVIGDCPSKETGNLPDNPLGHGADKFPVTIPKDTPPGTYSFAWTWFNNVGNREMYMNCAPIEVGGSGGTGDVAAVLGTFPDMFVANIPNDTCSTVENTDYVFPEPGDSVVTAASLTAGTALVGDCASMTKMGAGAGKLGSPAQASGAPAASGGASSVVATPVPSATGDAGLILAPGASSQAVPSLQAPASSQAAAFSTLVVSQIPEAPAPTGSSPPATGECAHPCTNNGGVVCISETEFGLCNFGCAVSQALAAGMSCVNGSIQKRSINGAAQKRSARRRGRHFHRSHGSEMI